MPGIRGYEAFELSGWDYAAIAAYFVAFCLISWWTGRKEKLNTDDYFLAGRSLPWYVVGGSFIASNISSEHFVGMIGAAYIYGICVANAEWMNVLTFSMLIWCFIPFLLASKVFTTPEFMERRFNSFLRQSFAIVTVISNVVAFLAAVLYGGGIAIQQLFGWDLWFSILSLGVIAGGWAVWGGLKSVVWADFFTVIVMMVGGAVVTILGLQMLSGDSHSIVDGWRIMIERNRADSGIWREVVQLHAQDMARVDDYNRLSVIQPVGHNSQPWPDLIFGLFSVGIWYNVINQFMIQRVLGAKNMYHARMGIVLAGYMKVVLPFIIVVPGLIMFAANPEVLKLPWDKIGPEADKSYIHMLQTLIPAGLRGLFLAALFGAIQSTVNSVLNSTATIVTLDLYDRLISGHRKRMLSGFPVLVDGMAPIDGTESIQTAEQIDLRWQKHLVRVGMWTTVIILAISIVLAGYIQRLGGGLFVYIQELYYFFAPPFSAAFLLGVFWRRINARGATIGVVVGFAFGIAIKVAVASGVEVPLWIQPYAMQAAVNFLLSSVVCTAVSLMTPPPKPEQVSDDLTFNWRKLNITSELGGHWYSSVVLWWGVFVLMIAGLMTIFSGLVF